jgi:hypothetical protein
MNGIIRFLSISLLVTIASCGPTTSRTGNRHQLDYSKWSGPRPIFSSTTNELLAVQSVDNSLVAKGTNRLLSENKVYYVTHQVEEQHALLVFNDKAAGLKLEVPGYRHRPLLARWINAKLLYLEVWFNPHYGAYWIYDVENQKVVLQELENDGLDAWRQYQEGTRPADQKERN